MTNNNNVEELYEKAIDQITPNVLDQILEQDIVPMKAEDAILSQEKKKEGQRKMGAYLSVLGVAVAAMLLLFLYNRSVVETSITIDVNPSFEIQLNRQEKVKKVIAINEDAQKIVEQVDFTDKDLDSTMEKLMDAMDADGYFNKKAAVLVSVQNKKEETAQKIEKKVRKKMRRLCENSKKMPVIYTQSVRTDKEIDEIARNYHISKGRATFICNMTKRDSDWKVEDLASMSIEELVVAVKQKGVKVSEILEKGGTQKTAATTTKDAKDKKEIKNKATETPEKVKNVDEKEADTAKIKATKKPSQNEKQQEKGEDKNKTEDTSKDTNKKDKKKRTETTSEPSGEQSDDGGTEGDTQEEQRPTPPPDNRDRDPHRGREPGRGDDPENDPGRNGGEDPDNGHGRGR